MSDYKEQIQSIIDSKSDQWKATREHLHMNPELSFLEINTQKFVMATLDSMGISYEYGKDDFKYIIAVINPDNKRTIALRADMDALPIEEENDVPYKSQNPGVMHACGHDVHTTCLLGALDILNELKEDLDYRVVAVFQPGEEKLPGGASILLEKGLLQKYDPEFIIGQHVFPSMNAGYLGFKEGAYMASADEIRIKVVGKGGHAATPNECIDSVFISALLIQNLQSVISRYRNPTIQSVLSFGKINSDGGATNVLPPSVSIEGTFRSMDDEFRDFALDKIAEICRGMEISYGAKIELDILRGYPSLYNDPQTTQKSWALAKEYIGEAMVKELPIRLSAEDFAWYTKHIPGCFYRLGTGVAGKTNYGVHHPKFDIDPSAINLGAGFMAYLCLNYR